MEKQLKIMTYNICHGIDFTDAKKEGWKQDWWNIRLDKTASVLQEVGADVVGLNEVYDCGEKPLDHQAEQLACAANYPMHEFAQSITYEGRSYGNALLSVFKRKEKWVYFVPSPVGAERRKEENGYYESRVVLRTILDIDGQDVSVYVTHFGLNLLEKERMMATLCKLLDQEKNPVILMGDFNSEPDDEVLAPLYERLCSAAKACDYTEKTFSTYRNEAQIDYIFFSKEFEIKDFKRVDRNVSDHYPCVANVVLRTDK